MKDDSASCIEVPPWDASMRGAFLYIDGERLAWSATPTDGQGMVWSNNEGWVPVNPPAASPKKGPT